jgi:hypothetical protein
MRANMPRTGDRHVNEKPFRIALNLRESAPFYPLDLQKIAKGVLRRDGAGFGASAVTGFGAPRSAPAEVALAQRRDQRGVRDLMMKARLADTGRRLLPRMPAEFGRLLAPPRSRTGRGAPSFREKRFTNGAGMPRNPNEV